MRLPRSLREEARNDESFWGGVNQTVIPAEAGISPLSFSGTKESACHSRLDLGSHNNPSDNLHI